MTATFTWYWGKMTYKIDYKVGRLDKIQIKTEQVCGLCERTNKLTIILSLILNHIYLFKLLKNEEDSWNQGY